MAHLDVKVVQQAKESTGEISKNRYRIYSCAQNKPIGRHIMKQNADFQEVISQA